jgi:hypothetical protein
MQPNLLGEKAIGFDNGFIVKLVKRRLLSLKDGWILTVSDSLRFWDCVGSKTSLSLNFDKNMDFDNLFNIS